MALLNTVQKRVSQRFSQKFLKTFLKFYKIYFRIVMFYTLYLIDGWELTVFYQIKYDRFLYSVSELIPGLSRIS